MMQLPCSSRSRLQESRVTLSNDSIDAVSSHNVGILGHNASPKAKTEGDNSLYINFAS